MKVKRVRWMEGVTVVRRRQIVRGRRKKIKKVIRVKKEMRVR